MTSQDGELCGWNGVRLRGPTNGSCNRWAIPVADEGAVPESDATINHAARSQRVNQSAKISHVPVFPSASRPGKDSARNSPPHKETGCTRLLVRQS